ncbi:MAG: 3-dehydroquinate synthase [Lachnospiraceae bacterium]|nr:3-dehydroquinate synthase [Lachnospiraceae bacterium]
MTISINLPDSVDNKYDIKIERGILNRVKDELNLNRKVLIVTDDGVPSEYSKTIAEQCKDSALVVIKQGEESKNFDSFLLLQKTMLEHGFSRKDCAVAIGGGVIGDLTGFAASCYMRGIDFYNIPTTVLSQVDSSVGGKTAVDFMGVKNIVGTFYQPKKVLIDPDVLKTLSARQVSNGLVEAIKMAATFDEEAFEDFEKAGSVEELNIDEIIARAITIKADVVEKDEKEAGLRKVLNFGHTLGHGIEVSTDLLHGESVGIGMLAMCDDEVKVRIEQVLKKFNLPEKAEFDVENAIEAVMHDKKSKGDSISTIYVSKIGSYEMRDMKVDELKARIKTVLS